MVVVVNGVEHRAKLTLGALAELEETLSERSLIGLVERFESNAFSSRDVIALLGAGLRGGGAVLTDADLLTAEFEGGPMTAAKAAAELLARAFVVPG